MSSDFLLPAGAVTEESPVYNAEGYATGSASPPPSQSEAVGTGAEYPVPIVFCEDEETVMGHSGALPYTNTAVVQHAGQQKPVQNLYLAPVQTTEHPKLNLHSISGGALQHLAVNTNSVSRS